MQFIPACSLSLCLATFALGVQAQSSCSSDAQRPPVSVLERFINADCETCWGQLPADTALPPHSLVLDWIAPSAQGESAPLSVAANADALSRLAALGRSLPSASDRVQHPLGIPARALQGARLRVAHGLPFGGYMGASMALLLPVSSRSPLAQHELGPIKATLLLVETIPAGVDGTLVERNLVRNSAEVLWEGRADHPILAQPRRDGRSAAGAHFYTSQVMSIPEGTRPERLRVVGWLENPQHTLLMAAQTRCKP